MESEKFDPKKPTDEPEILEILKIERLLITEPNAPIESRVNWINEIIALSRKLNNKCFQLKVDRHILKYAAEREREARKEIEMQLKIERAITDKLTSIIDTRVAKSYLDDNN